MSELNPTVCPYCFGAKRHDQEWSACAKHAELVVMDAELEAHMAGEVDEQIEVWADETPGDPILQTTADALALMKELGLTTAQGCVGIGAGEWFVIIYGRRKKPPLVKWKGLPVRYRIGGGVPRAGGSAA